MRLIDADIADVVIIYDKGNELTQVSAIREYIERQKAFLDKFPTIDAVSVVRCENCKYGYPCGDEIVCYHPEYELAEGKWSYKKDFFCAFGDTKEGADNV